jgi:hypothetical protein
MLMFAFISYHLPGAMVAIQSETLWPRYVELRTPDEGRRFSCFSLFCLA